MEGYKQDWLTPEFTCLVLDRMAAQECFWLGCMTTVSLGAKALDGVNIGIIWAYGLCSTTLIGAVHVGLNV